VVRGVVLTVVVLLGLIGGFRNASDNRTQAHQVASAIGDEAKRGDVVLYCPDQLGPSVHRLLGDDTGLEEMTFPDLARPEIVNWVDYRDRIGATNPEAVAQRVIDRSVGATIWYVVSPGYRSVEGKCEALGAALSASRPDAASILGPDDDTYFEFMGLTRFGP
jgi:mannosyltransferase